MKKNTNGMFARVGATLTQKPAIVEWKGNGETKTFAIKPVSLGVLMQISEMMTAFEEDTDALTDSTIYPMLSNSHILARVVAAIIHHSEELPPGELIEWLYDYLTGNDLLHVVSKTIEQADVVSFLRYYYLDKKKEEEEDKEDKAESVNTPWTLIGSVIKYFRLTYHYTLFDISYVNLMMLLNTIPKYKFKKKGDEENDNPDEVDSMEDFLKLGLK